MKEAGSLVKDTPNLNPGLSADLAGTNEQSASKALMGLKQLKADDIGVLRYTRSSEFGMRVKCSNHAHDVSSRKRVSMWYRDQRIAVDKLARGQQKMFRSLIRVQNEKRRLQRQTRIRTQREMQCELRERAVAEREEAEKRLRDVIMTEAHLKEVREDDQKIPHGPLSGIKEEIDTETGEESKRDANNSTLDDKPINSISSSSGCIQSSTTPKLTPSATQTGEMLETVSKADFPPALSGKEKSLIKDSGMGLVSRAHFSREAKPSIDYNSNITDDTNPTHPLLEDDKVIDLNPHKVLPGIIPQIPQEPPSQTLEDGAACESKDSVFEEDAPTTVSRAKDQMVKEKAKRKSSDRVGPKSNYHIGIANRTFRLPDYQAPAVTSVVRYQRNSDGRLVPSEVAVKPASEEYKLPSRRAEYMVEKALEWEKKRQEVREKKLRGFLDRMKELEKREKMESQISTSLDYANREVHHRHQAQQHTVDRASNPVRAPTHHTAVGEALEKYHLKGDVQDARNCRYLRWNEEPAASRDEKDKMGWELRGRSDRRMSSWVMRTPSKGVNLSSGKLPTKHEGRHSLGF